MCSSEPGYQQRSSLPTYTRGGVQRREVNEQDPLRNRFVRLTAGDGLLQYPLEHIVLVPILSDQQANSQEFVRTYRPVVPTAPELLHFGAPLAKDRFEVFCRSLHVLLRATDQPTYDTARSCT